VITRSTTETVPVQGPDLRRATRRERAHIVETTLSKPACPEPAFPDRRINQTVPDRRIETRLFQTGGTGLAVRTGHAGSERLSPLRFSLNPCTVVLPGYLDQGATFPVIS